MGSSGMIIWLVVMFLVFYFLIIRPQKKREKQERELRNSIQPGDEIVTIGGFVGKVLSVKEDTVTFETGAARTKLTIKKYAIQSRISPEQEAPAEEVAEEVKAENNAVVESEPAAEQSKKKKLFGKKSDQE